MIELELLSKKIRESFQCENICFQNHILIYKIKSENEKGNNKHLLDGFEFLSILVCSGSLVAIKGKETINFNEHEMFFSTSSIRLSWSPDFEGYIVCACYQAIEDLKSIYNSKTLSLFSNQKTILFHSHELNLCYNYYLDDIEHISKLMANVNYNDFASRNTLYHLQMLIFSIVDSYNYNITLSNRQNHLYAQFIDALNKYESSTYTVQFFAYLLGVTPKYLSIVTQSICKKTALKVKDEYLTQKIKRIISETDISMLDIATLFGFDSQSNFSRFFKKETGLTPTEYKLMNEKV